MSPLLSYLSRYTGRFGGRNHGHTKRSRPRGRLQLEKLEDRTVPSTLGQIGGIGGDTLFNGAQIMDASGNSYLAGSFDQQADLDPTGSTQWFPAGTYVAKYTPNGTLAWATLIGGTTWGLVGDALGNNIYVAGSAGVTKLDSDDGSTLWVSALGGSGSSLARGVAVDGNSVFATGFFAGQVDFDPSAGSYILTSTGKGNTPPRDAFVWRLTADGNFVSAWKIGSASFDEGQSILAANGSIYVHGTYQGTVDFDPSPTATLNRTSVKVNGNTYTRGMFVAQYTPNGTPNWVQTIDTIAAGSANGVDQSATRMAADANSLYLSASFWGTVDFDRNNVFPTGQDILTSVAGSVDVVVAKYNVSNGDLAWVRGIGGPGSDEGLGGNVAVTDTGMVYSGGKFSQTVDFDPAPANTALLTSAGSFDGFILQLDTDGAYVNAWRMGRTGWDKSIVIGVYGGQLYSTGIFEGTAYFPTGGPLYSAGARDLFLMALDLTQAQSGSVTADSSSLLAASSSDAVAADEFFASGQTTQTLDADILAALVSLEKKK